jgi:arsenite methyltransferase
MSLLCIHNLAGEEDRDLACGEIARVLKPRGVAILADHTDALDYAKALAKAGLTVETAKSYLFRSYLPVTIIVARKIGVAKQRVA